MNDMTSDPTIDQHIAAWLASEAPQQLPDRVLSRTFASTRAIRQVGWVPGWRSYRMRSMPAAIAAGAVAILVLALGGIALMGSRNGVASPSPTSIPSTATAAAAPAAAATASAPSHGEPLGTAIVRLDGTVREDLGLPSSAWAPKVSPDGSSVVYVDGNRLFVRVLGPGAIPRDLGVTVTGAVTEFGDYPVDAAPAWSPDGTMIAYASSGDIYVTPADGASAPRRLTTDPNLDEWPAWSPDGRTIYYVNAGATGLDDSGISPTQEVWAVKLPGGTPKRVTKDDVSELQPDIAGSGQIAIWQAGQIRAMDPANGHSASIQSPSGRAVKVPDGWNPRWSPDGSMLAILTFDSGAHTPSGAVSGVPSGMPILTIHIVDLSSGRDSILGPRVPGFWNPVSWTPDGALLINRYDCVAESNFTACH
jgi:hypothetical protein